MRKQLSLKAATQAGFTLIELIIVIVIIGILAAVAIPKLTDATKQARLGVQQGTLGALKSASVVVYAGTKAAVTCTLTAGQMKEPVCSGTTAITCTGVMAIDGTTDASFTCADGTATDPLPVISCALAGC